MSARQPLPKFAQLQQRWRAAVRPIAEPIERWREQGRWEWRLHRDIRRAHAGRLNRPARSPDFVIIGAPKSGTSWLRAVLTRHHGVIMVKEEIEFFSSHLDKRLDWYLDHFREGSGLLDTANWKFRNPYGDCLIGEKSASYCAMTPPRIRLLNNLAPDARLILMMRDPVKRHWAHASQFFLKRYGEQSLDAANPLKDQLLQFFESAKRFGEYSTMLDRWSDICGEERLLVLLQEEARTQPEWALEQTLRHIGASLEFDKNRIAKLFGTKNEGPGLPMPPDVRHFLNEMFAPEYERLEARFGARLAPWK